MTRPSAGATRTSGSLGVRRSGSRKKLVTKTARPNIATVRIVHPASQKTSGTIQATAMMRYPSRAIGNRERAT
jgi:hypothetical protein